MLFSIYSAANKHKRIRKVDIIFLFSCSFVFVRGLLSFSFYSRLRRRLRKFFDYSVAENAEIEDA
jgi:hypothetical protein